MIAFNDTLGQRQAQSPTTFLGSKTWREYTVKVPLLDALTRICHINIYPFIGGHNLNINATLTIHRIDSILAKILYHPLKKRAAHTYHNGTFRSLKTNLHMP